MVGWLAPEEYRVVHTVSSGEEVIVPVEYITVLPSTSLFDSGGTVFARKKATTAQKKKAAEAREKAEARQKAEARKKTEGTASVIHQSLRTLAIVASCSSFADACSVILKVTQGCGLPVLRFSCFYRAGTSMADIYDWAIKVTGHGGFKLLHIGAIIWPDEFVVGSLRLFVVPSLVGGGPARHPPQSALVPPPPPDVDPLASIGASGASSSGVVHIPPPPPPLAPVPAPRFRSMPPYCVESEHALEHFLGK